MGEPRIDRANRVLGSFSESRIERRKGGFYVCWQYSDGTQMSRRWQCLPRQNFYPVWHHKWPGGGTASTALSQLIRWLRDQPVLPISTWDYWSGHSIGLLPSTAVTELRAGGYPTFADCVLCRRLIIGGLDWWNLDGVSGPCCSFRSGCRQEGARLKADSPA